MIVYIATPINGRKGKTFEEKRLMAEARVNMLKKLLAGAPEFKGCEFTSTFDLPHEDDTTEARAMGDCVAAVLNCDAVYMDTGWQASKGCNLEYRAAKIYGKKIYYHDHG